MAVKSIQYYLPVIILFVTGFSIYGQDKPILIWENQKAVAVSLLNSVDTPVIKVKGEFAAISGRLERTEKRTIFYPTWPFSQDMQYEIWDDRKVIYSFGIPEKELSAPVTVDVYPKLDVLPENLLKFYLVFSVPMAVGNVYDHISMLDEDEHVLPNTFLQLEPELWNKDNTILTIWLDPGRIKRDLVLNKTLGSPLIEGNNYGIKISGKWKTAHGQKLGEDILIKFKSGSADRKSPNTNAWNIHSPESGSNDPLVIEFDEVLDFVLSGECIFIEMDDKEIEGRVGVLQNEKRWMFTPSKEWAAGEYQINIETRLEDLAGNNLNRLFDVELADGEPTKTSEKAIVTRTLLISD